MAWIEHAAQWELDRSAGTSYPLQEPAAAIDDAESAASRIALTLLAELFKRDGKPQSAAVVDFLRAARDLIPAPAGTH